MSTAKLRWNPYPAFWRNMGKWPVISKTALHMLLELAMNVCVFSRPGHPEGDWVWHGGDEELRLLAVGLKDKRIERVNACLDELVEGGFLVRIEGGLRLAKSQQEASEFATAAKMARGRHGVGATPGSNSANTGSSDICCDGIAAKDPRDDMAQGRHGVGATPGSNSENSTTCTIDHTNPRADDASETPEMAQGRHGVGIGSAQGRHGVGATPGSNAVNSPSSPSPSYREIDLTHPKQEGRRDPATSRTGAPLNDPALPPSALDLAWDAWLDAVDYLRRQGHKLELDEDLADTRRGWENVLAAHPHVEPMAVVAEWRAFWSDPKNAHRPRQTHATTSWLRACDIATKRFAEDAVRPAPARGARRSREDVVAMNVSPGLGWSRDGGTDA